MKPYGLLGEKLGHSFSPLIHSRLGEYEYRLFPTPKEELDAFLTGGSFAGLNVTMPYKKAVIPYCKELSPLAKRLGSVNTLKVTHEGLMGYNTDYYGFAHMLSRGNIPVVGEKCAVIGSGGVSPTVCAVLEDLGAEKITVVSHKMNTPAFIETIADHTVVVNTSPVGMFPGNGVSPVDLRQFHSLRGVADLIYNPLKTALLLQAEELGVPRVGGLSMLVARAKQAAEIFEDKGLDDGIIDTVTRELGDLCETICLIGMPGSGKTTIGKLLAKKLGKEFIDTDEEIVRAAGKSIPEIFSEDGEDAFRRLETKVLAEATAKSGRVIATGGGAVVRPENRNLLKQNGRIVLVERGLDALSTEGRPLSSSEDALRRLYEERQPIYRSLADIVVQNAKSPAEAVTALLGELNL
jgi:shikimate dehydrogenase